MAHQKVFIFLLIFGTVHSASIIETSYEYVMNLGKNLAPSFMSILDCFGEQDAWVCAKEKAGIIFDGWDKEVDKQRRMWREEADAEVRSSGRSLEEMPSVLGKEIEEGLGSLSDLVQNGVARALTTKKPEGSKKTPPKLQMAEKSPEILLSKDSIEQSVVNGEGKGVREEGRGVLGEVWKMGESAIDAVADHLLEKENEENGIADRSTVAEQRGKKKKKKKAILKLLLLGAVLKAKIGTLLQILSFKLQVKFFIIALIGLAINLARFWVELKHKHQQPQKVIYYEHAQHQHHYEHEEEPGWGPWSRSIIPEEKDEIDSDVSPYRAQERTQMFPTKPLLTLS
ncbi:uncharacterized protein LOC119836502 isoform X1 [Zerene cesonia]|uniref:uncharacterized protein LOC119836502 isoform X1 n=1 Tax=Zerene cesonia TaxID=33412 RepID=UPI0018E55EC0|nr:uncharacterized protein LOC119836502 isoform X1 [Zerene cesonia]